MEGITGQIFSSVSYFVGPIRCWFSLNRRGSDKSVWTFQANFRQGRNLERRRSLTEMRRRAGVCMSNVPGHYS